MHVPPAPLMALMLTPFALWAILYALSEWGDVNLKPAQPWLLGLCWVLWAGGLVGEILERSWANLFGMAYVSSGILLGWLHKRYLFESRVRPSRSLAAVLTVPQPTYMGVRDVAGAAAWYTEKFGLRKRTPTEELRPDGVTLQFGPETHPLVLVPKDPTKPRPVPVFFTRSVKKARKRLVEDGFSAGPLQQDRQGTSFFEVLDGEGNSLEVSERP